MTLHTGSTLGHYEVLGSLGAGGMGEVYRARDARLGREVAIKVLPPEVADDPERLARFEREARALAALNHPNIATLFGMESQKSSDSDDGAPFLVMEVVDGPTLAERIAEGPIPVDEALSLFLQIAEGLEAAHERGIVHRDLKPANVKLTAEDSTSVGRVKILDFGLAKAFDAAGADDTSASPTVSPAATASPTLTLAATVQGVILGTAAYMSPEQARGKPVDKRADVWAFGVCLVEALTGERPFGGDDVSTTLASVLKDEPDLGRLGSRVPPGLERLIRRCLEKDPRLRLRDIGEARITLARARTEGWSEEGATGEAAGGGAGSRTSRKALSWVAGALLVGALGGLGAGMLLWSDRASPPEPAAPKRFGINAPPGTEPGDLGGVALSPDGRTLVVSARRVGEGADTYRLYRRDLDELTMTPLSGTGGDPGTLGALNPFFSRDGLSVGYFADRHLWRVGLDGKPPISLCPIPAVRGNKGAWTADGSIVYSLSGSPSLWRVSATGGEPTEIPLLADTAGELWFSQLLPGDRHALVAIGSEETLGSRVAIATLETGEVRDLTPGRNATLLESGHLVFLREGNLWAAPFDVGTLSLSADPVPVVSGVEQDLGRGQRFALSESGDLVYVRALSDGRELVWVDPTGAVEPMAFEPAPIDLPRISPDGRKLVVANDRDQALWIYDLARGTQQILVPGPAQHPAWSPDGEWLAFQASDDEGGLGIFRLRSDGTGGPERLTRGAQRPESWSPDGKWIVFMEPERDWDVGMVAAEPSGAGVAEREIRILEIPSIEVQPAVSTDGRWLAVATTQPGPLALFVWPFPSLEGPGTRISLGYGDDPTWAPDGSALYYRVGSDMMSVEIRGESPEEWGAPEVLFSFAAYGRGPRTHDVAPDGRFVMLRSTVSEEEVRRGLLVHVGGWMSELGELVPIETKAR